MTFFKVNLALQLNVKIEKSEGMEYVFKSLPTIYFPVLWFHTSVVLPDGMSSALHFLVNIPMIMVIASIIGIITGSVGIFLVWRNLTGQEVSQHPIWTEKLNYIRNVLTFKNEKEDHDMKIVG